MHTGPATQHSGDWFGAAVNTAARVSGAATGGEVLVTDGTRRAAGELDDLDFQERGRHEFTNVSQPVTLYAALRREPDRPEQLPIDPVCRMAVSPTRAAGRMTYQGVEYHFCSLRCACSFWGAPERYAAEVRQDLYGASTVRLATALVQGGSYIGFGLWSLLAREHYRRTHRIRRDDWVLNSHGGWLLAVGTTLVAGAQRRQTGHAEIRLSGSQRGPGTRAQQPRLATEPRADLPGRPRL